MWLLNGFLRSQNTIIQLKNSVLHYQHILFLRLETTRAVLTLKSRLIQSYQNLLGLANRDDNWGVLAVNGTDVPKSLHRTFQSTVREY